MNLPVPEEKSKKAIKKRESSVKESIEKRKVSMQDAATNALIGHRSVLDKVPR